MSHPDRRQWLFAAGAATAAALLPTSRASAAGFTLPPLPYPADALEPHIDAKTMEIHHGRHHKTYVDNLNTALAGTEWADKPVEEVLRHLDKIPEEKRAAVNNNGGGHYNHAMFWQIMTRAGKGGKPSDDFIKAWGGDLDSLKKAVTEAGKNQFGSGWAWVAWVPAEKRLTVLSTANQDNPMSMQGGWFPVFGVDVWEHAYYLKYQNKRADYLAAWWNVVNWDAVNTRFKVAQKG
jgi:Fe-Mn family superoxide dismutase